MNYTYIYISFGILFVIIIALIIVICTKSNCDKNECYTVVDSVLTRKPIVSTLPDTLFSNGASELLPNRNITSKNNLYRLVYQTDGNLVLYDNINRAIWATNKTTNMPGKTIMQADGNLVCYDRNGKPYWASNTGKKGSGPFRLIMQNDRNVVIYDKNNTPTWSSNTFTREPIPIRPIITSNVTMQPTTSAPIQIEIAPDDPNDLPINRYPFIGSHDSAAYQSVLDLDSVKKGINSLKAAIAGQIPLVLCQTFDFADQYVKGGCRMFDLRCQVEKGEIQFAHGPIPLQMLNDDKSFERLLRQVISNKDFIILSIVAERTNREYNDIMKIWDTYLTQKGLKNNSYVVDKLSDCDRTVRSYLDAGINFVLFKDDFKIGNWDGSQQCFPVNVEFYDGAPDRQYFFGKIKDFFSKGVDKGKEAADAAKRAAEEAAAKARAAAEEARRALVKINNPCIQSCLPGENNDRPLKKIIKHVTDKYNEYVLTKPSKFFVIQAFWQASTETEQIVRTIACFGKQGSGLKATSVITEQSTNLNSTMYNLFIKNKWLPNIVIFDNVNECTRKLRLALLDYYRFRYTNRPAVLSLTC